MIINLANQRGLDAKVTADGVRTKSSHHWVDPDNNRALSARILKGTLENDLAALLENQGGDLDFVAQALIDGDPEVDLERFGAFLKDTSRIYINTDGDIARGISRMEVVYTPDGEVRQRRPARSVDPNISLPERPLRWTGRRMPKKEAVRRFVFSRTLQLTHVNGLTYDFLYDMAADLAETDDLLLLGAGLEGSDPLILRRGAKPQRAFLEGRIRENAYLLLLHLTDLELKPPSSRE